MFHCKSILFFQKVIFLDAPTKKILGKKYILRSLTTLLRCIYANYGPCDEATKPSTTRPCDPTPPDCGIGWMATAWDHMTCSATCGYGTITRYVWCSSDGSYNTGINCDERTKPETTTTCILHDCGEWEMTEWSECDVDCGYGWMTREVECVPIEEGILHSSSCLF